MKQEFNIDLRVLEYINLAQEEAKSEFTRIDRVKEYNQLKVIKAMQINKLSDTHFHGTTGYGYDDKGRDVLDDVYRDVFKA